MRLELSAEADADLMELLEFGVSRFGFDVGRDYFFSFDKSFALLREHPRAGAERDDADPGVRCLVHRSHRIFYEIQDDRIWVLRIVHHARDVRDRL